MKLWGGRFEKATNKQVDDFQSSISFDSRLYAQDIEGSIAHATMLGGQGIITVDESKLICSTLKDIKDDIENGKVEFTIDAEDIHMNIETLLIERIGDTGKKLHTGRSRNDQVALDMRMYVKQATKNVIKELINLENGLLKVADKHTTTVMPGYTHLQKAQPVTLGHYIMAYFQMFTRDIERFEDSFKRCDKMPLGSGALATTTYPLNRYRTAELLGFSDITQNSLDSVSDRDFCIEFISDCSMTMMHLSRICEELILWSTNEYQFIEMDDSFSTGSSIMPQKKNPDVAELIRGKTGRVYGDLVSLLAVMKSLPLAYNKDMQEDKETLFDAYDTVIKCIKMFTGMISTVKFNEQKMLEGAKGGFTNATDAADYLVKKGLPFREAHKVIGQIVLNCIKNKKNLFDLSLDEYKKFSDLFENDIYDAISLETCIKNRNIPGGPAPEAVKESIKKGYEFLTKRNPD